MIDVLKAYSFQNRDKFFDEKRNLEQHPTRCSAPAKHAYPKNVYQIREALFPELDFPGNIYTSPRKHFEQRASLTQFVYRRRSTNIESQKWGHIEK